MITDNELHSNYKHGGLDYLITSDKSSLVAAVNEIDEDLATHMADTMPHQFTDGTTTYKWGLVMIDGVLNFVYEEVV